MERLPKYEDQIKGIDSLIRICRENNSTISKEKLDLLFFKWITSLFNENEEINGEEYSLNLIDEIKVLENKKQIAISILRLMAESQFKFLTENPWRPRIINLFDTQFEEDLYKEKNIESKMQAHEKCERLVEFIKFYEDKYQKAIQLLTSLERMKAHRHSLLGVINNNSGRIVLQPFLPKNIIALLGELYKRIEVYIESRDDKKVVDSFSSATEDINQFIKDLKIKKTIYSDWLANGVGNSLLKMVENDFKANKAAQPAKLIVEVLDKKYPFHNINEIVDLGFKVINKGPGYAYDTKMILVSSPDIEILNGEVGLGRLTPGKIYGLEVSCKVVKSSQRIDLLLEIKWKDFDGTFHSEGSQVELSAQREDITWQELSQMDPYSLEAVIGEQDLIGRKDLLNRLIATSTAPSLGSSIIHGQKRVGKTSIAKAVQSHLRKQGYLVIYIEGGDYVEPTGMGTIARLGKTLCRELKYIEPRISHLIPPKFEEALSPMVEFLDEVSKIISNMRLIIILDEFDQLPFELYNKGPIGNAFFLTLRSITSRPNIGFILVGGERMTHIMDYQGDQLNKWNVLSVDYFNRETDWNDFKELVTRPVQNYLDYTIDALSQLHESTAGNPYFTKLVCRSVLEMAVKRRDCYITNYEIDEGVNRTVELAERNTFQHFWEDGIFDSGEKGIEKSIRRRKILVALSDSLKTGSPTPLQSIIDQPIVKEISTVETELREFVSRKVLISNEESKYDFKVPLLHYWLKRRGIQDIISTFGDLDAALRKRQKEEENKIKSTDIVQLVNKWVSYKGQTITEDKVRSWIDQFPNLRDQLLMFKILKGVKYYSNTFVRERMKEIDGIVKRSFIQKVEKAKFKRSDIIVSYIDGPAKSGAEFARLYADEAKIYVDNVIEKGKIFEEVENRKDIQAIVFIDDFVGTGQSALEYLTNLKTVLQNIIEKRELKIFFIAMVAYYNGWKKLENEIPGIGIPIETHACEILDESSRCFGEKSSIFSDQNEREEAKKIAIAYGRPIVKKNPLGYGDLEIAVVFERGCPNNSLPILWSESINPQWTPLFKRD